MFASTTIVKVSGIWYNVRGDDMEELKLCKEIIQKCKVLLDKKDYEGLEMYLDEREKFVEICLTMSKNEEAEYLENLVKALDKN